MDQAKAVRSAAKARVGPARGHVVSCVEGCLVIRVSGLWCWVGTLHKGIALTMQDCAAGLHGLDGPWSLSLAC